MNTYKLIALLLALLVKPVFAETVSENKLEDGIISVSGDGVLVAPADAVLLRLSAKTIGSTPKDAEKNGYQTGLRLKGILKKFGIDEKSLEESSTVLDSETLNNKIQYAFEIAYQIEFRRFDLLDTLREKCVEAGANNFNISGLISDKYPEYKSKVRSLAYQNAKDKAQAILEVSGLKLGKPIFIDANQQTYLPGEYQPNPYAEGLGAVDPGIEPKDPLLQKRETRLMHHIEVKFKIIE